MSKKRKHRLTRHDLKTDKFVESTMELVSTARHHAPRFIFSGIALIVLLVIVSYVASGRRKANMQAERFLSSATASFMNGEFEAARDGLEDITRRFWGTRASHQALFYLGSTYYALRDYDKAESNFEQFLRAKGGWPLLQASAALGIANCHEQKQQFLVAAGEYESVADNYGDSPLAPEALISAARCYQAIGQALAARPLYERVKNSYPDSELAGVAELHLRILSGAEQSFR